MASNQPTETPEWAESAPSENIEEPSAERSDGYNKDEARPSDQFNWLIRAAFRWIRFARDGLGGDFGEVEITNDTSSLFQLDITDGPSGLATITEWLIDRVTTDEVRSSSTDPIDVKDTNDDFRGFTLERLVPATGINNRIRVTDDQESVADGGFQLASLEGDAGKQSVVVIIEDGIETRYFEAADDADAALEPISDLAHFNFADDSGTNGNGFLVGRNTAKAGALVDFSGQSPSQGTTLNTQFEWGLSASPTYEGAGIYEFDLGYSATVSSANIGGTANVVGGDLASGGGSDRIDEIVVKQQADDTARVKMFDTTGSLADPDSSKFMANLYFTLS